MIDLDARQLAIVQSVLARHVPECEVRAFGSRVQGTAKPYSDLDLAVIGPAPLSGERLAALREALSESDLPIRVDVLDWHAITENFRQIIAARFEVLQTPPTSDHPEATDKDTLRRKQA